MESRLEVAFILQTSLLETLPPFYRRNTFEAQSDSIIHFITSPKLQRLGPDQTISNRHNLCTIYDLLTVHRTVLPSFMYYLYSRRRSHKNMNDTVLTGKEVEARRKGGNCLPSLSQWILLMSCC